MPSDVSEYKAWREKELHRFYDAVMKLIPPLENVAHFTSGTLTKKDKIEIFRLALSDSKMTGMFEGFLSWWK